MKFVLVLALSIISVVSSEETYGTEHDDFDIEPIVKNMAELEAFADCFIHADDSICTDLTAYFKKDLPEAIQQDCVKCTAAQKNLVKRFLEELKKKNPAKYAVFKAKFDPENKHLDGLQA